MIYSPSVQKLPYVVQNNPFFDVLTHEWFIGKGYVFRPIQSSFRFEYLKHLHAVSDFEYENIDTGLKIGFIGNVVSICGWHEPLSEGEKGMWVEMWYFTNPMKSEALKAIIQAYKNSL